MKPARTIQDLSPLVQKKINIASDVGLNNTQMPESVSTYQRAAGEITLEGNNNSLIVLGRDRPRNKLSGYGGAGHTQCGSISMVVGRPQEYGLSSLDPITDAATVYISQKSDVDKNYGLADGSVGNSSAESCVAIKADSTRIIGRAGIKIVTGTDETYASGEEILKNAGIDLNSGNQQGSYTVPGFAQQINALQPIPKGDNLISYLENLAKRIDELSSIFAEYVKIQNKVNTAISSHTHPAVTPVGPGYSVPSVELAASIPSFQAMITSLPVSKNSINRNNISIDKRNYLSKSGPVYINSRNNRTT